MWRTGNQSPFLPLDVSEWAEHTVFQGGTIEKCLSEIRNRQHSLAQTGRYWISRAEELFAERRGAKQTRLLPRASAGGFAARTKKKNSDDKHT